MSATPNLASVSMDEEVEERRAVKVEIAASTFSGSFFTTAGARVPSTKESHCCSSALIMWEPVGTARALRQARRPTHTVPFSTNMTPGAFFKPAEERYKARASPLGG